MGERVDCCVPENHHAGGSVVGLVHLVPWYKVTFLELLELMYQCWFGVVLALMVMLMMVVVAVVLLLLYPDHCGKCSYGRVVFDGLCRVKNVLLVLLVQ